MSQVVRASCPACGTVDLMPEEVLLYISPDRACCAFACPSCNTACVRAVDGTKTRLLLEAGVVAIEAPAFTDDDQLDFHDELRGLDVVGAVLAATPRSRP